MNGSQPVRVVVVDDEAPIRELVRSYLIREAMEVHLAEDGPSALETVRRVRPDVVVLDLMLPGMDGIEVCGQLRSFTDAYVVMLTARDEEVDRILGLSIGADDYVVKPFSPRELVARIRALLRRARLPRDTALPSGLSLDVASRRVTVDGQETHLTNLEYAILVALAEVPGVVLTRPQLLAAAWGDDFVGDDHVLDVHVGNLRRKLADDPSAPRFVETVRGVGFRLVTA